MKRSALLLTSYFLLLTFAFSDETWHDAKHFGTGSSLTSIAGISLKFGGNRLQLVGAPVADSDAATKKYVDDAVGGLSSSFLGLTDTPDSYSGQGLKAVRVNTGATDLEFFDLPTIPSDISGLHYVTTQAESALSAEFSLGSLGAGLLKQTVSAGVATPAIATEGSDYLDSARIDDTAYDATTWNGDTTHAPSKNAVRDKFESLPAEDHSITFVVDGSGSVLTTGTKNLIKIPFGGTLQGWLLVGSPSGSVTVDIYRAADGVGLPVTSIIGGSGTKPALSSAVENSSTSFTSWTSTTLTAKDNLAINLSGVTTTTYCALTLYFK
jgi:hypothetical protein